MTLEEIEAKADELVIKALEPDTGVREVELLNLQIENLKDLAMIKRVADQRAQWIVHASWRHAELDNQRRWGRPLPPPGGATTPETVITSTEVAAADPTKPVADRLHELVSYLIGKSEEYMATAKSAVQVVSESKAVLASKAYDDAATKLQEILQEGGI